MANQIVVRGARERGACKRRRAVAHTEPPLDGGPLVRVAVRDQKDRINK